MREKYYRVAKTIARWKVDTAFENWLGSMADKSEFWKCLYVLYYKVFDAKYFKHGIPFLLKEIERQRSNTVNIGADYLKRDMIYSLHRFGASFEEYFVFQFYNLNAEGRSKFNTLKMQYGYCELVNGAEVRDKFEDKGTCYELFKKYYKRDVITYLTEADKEQLDHFVEKHPKFICKPLNGHSGQGIKIHDVNNKEEFEEFRTTIRGGFVVEELIQQAAPMSDLHEDSINTLRIVTFRNKEKIDIIGAALRMGTGNAFVDNAGAGGIYASVNTEEGIVDSIAIDNRGNQYFKHPDTKVIFPGFIIPDWKDAIKMIQEMAMVIPEATMISWDLAYSIRGWCMVEGNDVGEAYLYQAPRKQGLKERIIKAIDEYVTERRSSTRNRNVSC